MGNPAEETAAHPNELFIFKSRIHVKLLIPFFIVKRAKKRVPGNMFADFEANAADTDETE
jgi:hypothetical protein